MSEQSGQHLQASDFVMAMQDMGTFIDVSVDDLMQIYQMAQKHARMRNRESVAVEKLMSHPVITIQSDHSLSEAAHLLVTNKISGLPVVDDDNKLVGIITEADFLRTLGVPTHHHGHSVWHTLEHMFAQPVQSHDPDGQVGDLMIKNAVTVMPQQTLHQVLEVMKHHQIKRVVVCDEAQHVVGMITRSDLVKVFFDRFNLVNANLKKDKTA
jgi:CBS domain-containing membrane protein